MNNKYSAGQKPTFTRKISPKMGLLGFLGLSGFLGFLPQFFREDGILPVPFPLIFFCFFGWDSHPYRKGWTKKASRLCRQPLPEV